MIRCIMHLGPRDHVGQDQFESVKLLNTQNMSRQLRLNHMFKIFHSLGPSYFNQFFTKISDIHSHATRSSSFNFQYQGLVHTPNTHSLTRLHWIGIICLRTLNLFLINVLLSLPWRNTLLEMPGCFMSLLTLLNFLPPPPFVSDCFALFLVTGTCLFVCGTPLELSLHC